MLVGIVPRSAWNTGPMGVEGSDQRGIRSRSPIHRKNLYHGRLNHWFGALIIPQPWIAHTQHFSLICLEIK